MHSRGQKFILENFVIGFEDKLNEKVLADGRKGLKSKLMLDDESVNFVFCYLVKNCSLLEQIFNSKYEEASNSYIAEGYTGLRDFFEITDEDSLDLEFLMFYENNILFSTLLEAHILENIDVYSKTLIKQGRQFVRNILFLNSPDLSNRWRSVVKLLMQYSLDFQSSDGLDLSKIFTQTLEKISCDRERSGLDGKNPLFETERG